MGLCRPTFHINGYLHYLLHLPTNSQDLMAVNVIFRRLQSNFRLSSGLWSALSSLHWLSLLVRDWVVQITSIKRTSKRRQHYHLRPMIIICYLRFVEFEYTSHIRAGLVLSSSGTKIITDCLHLYCGACRPYIANVHYLTGPLLKFRMVQILMVTCEQIQKPLSIPRT